MFNKFKKIQFSSQYKIKKSHFIIKNDFTKKTININIKDILKKDKAMKEIVLDTETTGISVKDGHRIVEIGCIELENLIPTKNKFHYYLNPERKVSEQALKVHGYSDEFLSKQKKFNE